MVCGGDVRILRRLRIGIGLKSAGRGGDPKQGKQDERESIQEKGSADTARADADRGCDGAGDRHPGGGRHHDVLPERQHECADQRGGGSTRRRPAGGPFGLCWSADLRRAERSEEHTSELQSLMRISYAVFCLKKKITNKKKTQ